MKFEIILMINSFFRGLNIDLVHSTANVNL